MIECPLRNPKKRKNQIAFIEKECVYSFHF